MMDFRFRLVHELTQLDIRESAAERRRRIPENIYRLGHYLHAAQQAADDVEGGATLENAFTEYFTPTRGMHTVARRLKLALDVERGQWIQGGRP